MTKPASSGIPGVDAMTDTFDFFKNMWSGMPGMNLPGLKNIPGMVMPTLSTDEINKQITDLRAVESWLTLNLNMLQGTIQALEVQKATISTLQTMGESLTAVMQPPQMSSEAPGKKSAFESPFTQPPAAKKEEAPAAPAAPAAKETGAAPSMAAAAAEVGAMANPAAWWGMLQDQFKQAVNTAAALTPESAAAPAQEKEKPAAPAPRKRKSPPKE